MLAPSVIFRFLAALCLLASLSAIVHAADPKPTITAIAALTDPAKIATLKGERAATWASST